MFSLYWSDVTEYGSSLKRLCGNDTSQDQQQVSFDLLLIDYIVRGYFMDNFFIAFCVRLYIQLHFKTLTAWLSTGSAEISTGVTRKRIP